jgi:hypothetical protein
MNKKINDRIDLTLECIRRYYNDEDSPLSYTIKRYNKFLICFLILKDIVNIFYYMILCLRII